MNKLDSFLSDVVMTGYYLAEPPRLATKNLHDAEMKCLKIISEFGPIQVHQIAELMFATKARATQLTKILENYGYAKHETGTDKRVKLISITDEGEEIVNNVRKKYTDLANAIEGKLGKVKTDKLCQLLDEITPLNKLINNKES